MKQKEGIKFGWTSEKNRWPLSPQDRRVMSLSKSPNCCNEAAHRPQVVATGVVVLGSM